MSAYKKFHDIQFRDLTLLKQALADLGFTTLEEGESLGLFGWHGDLRPERAQLVIRREHVGSASNDIGFMKTAQGYVPMVSEFDSRNLRRGKFLPDLRTAYNTRVVSQIASKLRGTVSKTTSGNAIKMVVRY